ncbi:MAG: alpha/beta fold hydrolase [Christensenella sp.]|nr:alpha/beta fold hydrolase [Christensenella sp.]
MAVKKQETAFASADGKSRVYACVWKDEAVEPRFLVQLCHGMCEYIDRYTEFAEYLCKYGAVVCGNDHLGHGKTKNLNKWGTYGYFAEKDGEKLIVEDMYRLTKIAKEHFPGIPFLLMGHSMGSMAARSYMTKHGDEAQGAVFMGTSGANPLTGLIRFLARVGIIFGRAKKPAKLLSQLAFSKYNDRYEEVRTKDDWLSRDPERVDKYEADAQCTFLFTDQAAYDFANLVDEVSGIQWAEKLPKAVPYFILSGAMDPVGNYGDGVEEVYGWMMKAGLENITFKLYEGARHELLNEINRDEVYADLRTWMETAASL